MTPGSGTIAAYLLLVFSAGVAVGGFGHRLYTANTVSATSNRKTPDEYRRDYMNEMRQRLRLSDPQAIEVEKVLDATRDRYREFRARTRPDIEKIQADQTNSIRGILSADQMKEYDTMRAERDAQRKKSFGGGI